jgi:hypothetical protein
MGIEDLTKVSDQLENLNYIMVGKKGLYVNNGYYTYSNDVLKVTYNLCSLFPHCTNNYLYIRTHPLHGR